jgi:hypothetical protein
MDQRGCLPRQSRLGRLAAYWLSMRGESPYLRSELEVGVIAAKTTVFVDFLVEIFAKNPQFVP